MATATPVLATSTAFWLGLYGAVVSTIVGAAALYRETFRRVKVGANEDFLVAYQGGRHIVMSPEAVLEHADDIPAEARRPILTIRIVNRGRHAVQVRTISKAYWFQVGRMLFDEPMAALPCRH